ncbi:MAG: DUF4124 domain-containing protein [Gammaproteobacteria bacterium]
MNVKILLLTLCVVTAPAFMTAQAQQVYRWVDAQGNIHYSQTPPPDAGTKAKLVNVEPPPPDPTGIQQQKKLIKSVDAADAAQQKSAAEAQQETQKKAQQQQACTAARAQLQQYMEAHRVITNGDSTKPTYYTGEDLVKFRQQAQEQVNKVCGGN